MEDALLRALFYIGGRVDIAKRFNVDRDAAFGAGAMQNFAGAAVAAERQEPRKPIAQEDCWRRS